MRDVPALLKRLLDTRVTVTVAAVLLVGGGAAIASPGLGTPPATDAVGHLDDPAAGASDVLQSVELYCDEENPDAPFCRGPSDPSQAPDGPDDTDDPDDTDAPGDEGESEAEGDPEVAGGDAEGFSAWVRSLPKDWGCVRGQLVAHAARNGPHEGYEDLTFETAADAAAELGLEGRCVDVAIARADGGDPEVADDDGDASSTAERADRGEAGPAPAAPARPDDTERATRGRGTDDAPAGGRGATDTGPSVDGGRPDHAGGPASDRGRGGAASKRGGR